jgi:hypothetical protein
VRFGSGLLQAASVAATPASTNAFEGFMRSPGADECDAKALHRECPGGFVRAACIHRSAHLPRHVAARRGF